MWYVARVATVGAACLFLCSCASTQLNYNTLDLASTTDRLLTEQIVDNLGHFIDTGAAVPAQVIMNGGTTTTANTISPSFSAPLSKAVTVGTTVATAASKATTDSISSVTGAKSLTVGASNVATQNWAFEPVTDPDQLRRLYDLYRFVVIGNQSPAAQNFLLTDYPLPYKTTTAGNQTNTAVDTVALSGPNCVVCVLPVQTGGKCSGLLRPEGVCVQLNPRLLPPKGAHSPWLLWTSNSGRPQDESRAPHEGDIYLGARGPYLMYVDNEQADRFAEFALLVAAAASSAPNPSSAASAGTGGGGKQPKAIATPATVPLILNQ